MSTIGKAYYRVAALPAGHTAARRTLTSLRKLGLLRDLRLPLDALDLPHPLVRELMRLWSRIHWAGTDGMMPPRELLALLRLAYACPAEGDTVELGSWVGLTTCYLAAVCQARGRGHVFAVDTFAGTKEGDTVYDSAIKYGGTTMDAFDRNVRASGLGHRVFKHVGLTTEMAAAHRDRPIGFLFIDADHSFDGVKADFEHWEPLVVPGGFIVFHDYTVPDVRRFVDGHVRSASATEVTRNPVPNLFAVVKRRRSRASISPATRVYHRRHTAPTNAR